MHSKVNQWYIYIYPLFCKLFSHIGYYRLLSRLSSAIQQILFNYFINSSVYMLIPNSWYIPPPHNYVLKLGSLPLTCQRWGAFHFLYILCIFGNKILEWIKLEKKCPFWYGKYGHRRIHSYGVSSHCKMMSFAYLLFLWSNTKKKKNVFQCLNDRHRLFQGLLFSVVHHKKYNLQWLISLTALFISFINF